MNSGKYPSDESFAALMRNASAVGFDAVLSHPYDNHHQYHSNHINPNNHGNHSNCRNTNDNNANPHDHCNLANPSSHCNRNDLPDSAPLPKVAALQSRQASYRAAGGAASDAHVCSEQARGRRGASHPCAVES